MKKVRVIWSNEALHDLEILHDFLAQESVLAARRITENILTRTRQLETFPESGATQKLRKKSKTTYRYLVEGNYKIIYRYDQTLHAVFVETIFDTRQDPPKLERNRK